MKRSKHPIKENVLSNYQHAEFMAIFDLKINDTKQFSDQWLSTQYQTQPDT